MTPNITQNSIDLPSQLFHQLMNELDKLVENFYLRNLRVPAQVDKDESGLDYKKGRLVIGTMVVDIYWYPLPDGRIRDWYDVTISSIKNSAKFIGKFEEFGDSKKILENILCTIEPKIDPNKGVTL